MRELNQKWAECTKQDIFHFIKDNETNIFRAINNIFLMNLF